MEDKDKTEFYSRSFLPLAGSLLLIPGIYGISIGIIIAHIHMGVGPSPKPPDWSFLILFAFVPFLCGAISIIGGVFCFIARFFYHSLIGGICAIVLNLPIIVALSLEGSEWTTYVLLPLPFGILGLAFILKDKNKFKHH